MKHPYDHFDMEVAAWLCVESVRFLSITFVCATLAFVVVTWAVAKWTYEEDDE